MTRFQRRTLLVVALLAVAVGLAGLSQSGLLEGATNLVDAPLAALQRGLNRAWQTVSGGLPPGPEVDALRQRNLELELEVSRLQKQIVDLEESQADLAILTNLLGYVRSQPQSRYLAANVIGLDPSPFLGYILLDRGSDDGVRRNMPVLTDLGLVGRVVEVTSAACKVQLITDPTSAVNAQLQTSRERGVVSGRIGGGLEMQYISQQISLQTGEKALTSGLGGQFPAGILIGTVSAVQRLEYEVLQRADLTPSVDFSRLEIVLIVADFQPVDLGPLIAPAPTEAP